MLNSEKDKFTANIYQYDKYLAKHINDLWPEEKNKSDDADDDGDEYLNLLSFPPNIKKNLLKRRRIQLIETLEKQFNGLYDKNCKILQLKKSTSTARQERYHFSDSFNKILIKGVEVNCRIVTTNMTTAAGGGGGGMGGGGGGMGGGGGRTGMCHRLTQLHHASAPSV